LEHSSKEERFRDLFEKHFGALAAYADRRCYSGDADDVVAETFSVAWRRFDAIPADAELPWLYGVARKVLANQRRGTRRWMGLLDRLRSEVPPEAWMGFDQAPPIVDALRRLKPDEREVLLLAAWEGLSHAEIGAAMGLSANAVGIRVHRAKKRLAEEMEREGAPARKESASAGHSGL
jgi:RNA polymerase sigma-70 factor (ECF subfamily)